MWVNVETGDRCPVDERNRCLELAPGHEHVSKIDRLAIDSRKQGYDWKGVPEHEPESGLEAFINERSRVYGDPVSTFARIAQVWSGILGTEVNACDVPLMQAGMKLVRTQVTPDYSDNSDDVEGYLDIFRQVVGDGMVHARTVEEYLRIKRERRS